MFSFFFPFAAPRLLFDIVHLFAVAFALPSRACSFSALFVRFIVSRTYCLQVIYACIAVLRVEHASVVEYMYSIRNHMHRINIVIVDQAHGSPQC